MSEPNAADGVVKDLKDLTNDYPVIAEHFLSIIGNFSKRVLQAARKATSKKAIQELLKKTFADFALPPGRIVCTHCGGRGHIAQDLNLVVKLVARPKPQNITRNKPGRAPEGCRWICCMCEGRCEVKKQTNDIRTHLQKHHGFLSDQIEIVFAANNGMALYEHFGPFTIEQAQENGSDFKPWKNTSTETDQNSATIPELHLTYQDLPITNVTPQPSTRQSRRAVALVHGEAATRSVGGHFGDAFASSFPSTIDNEPLPREYVDFATNNANYSHNQGAGGPQIQPYRNAAVWNPLRPVNPAELYIQTPVSSPPYIQGFTSQTYNPPTTPHYDQQQDFENDLESVPYFTSNNGNQFQHGL